MSKQTLLIWNYDSTGEADDTEDDANEDEDDGDDDEDGSYYYGYGCTIASTGPTIPTAAAVTQQKQVDRATVRRVTRDALAVEKPVRMLGDGAFDMLEWHDIVGEAIVPVAPYTSRNTR